MQTCIKNTFFVHTYNYNYIPYKNLNFSVLGTLQDIFEGDFGNARTKRKLEQLNEGFEKTNNFIEGK